MWGELAIKYKKKFKSQGNYQLQIKQKLRKEI